jgi:hypothetical protein
MDDAYYLEIMIHKMIYNLPSLSRKGKISKEFILGLLHSMPLPPALLLFFSP